MINVYFGYEQFGHISYIGMAKYQTLDRARYDLLSSSDIEPDADVDGTLIAWTYEASQVKQLFAIRSKFNPT